jgi:hypothetical protein
MDSKNCFTGSHLAPALFRRQVLVLVPGIALNIGSYFTPSTDKKQAQQTAVRADA